MDHSQFHPGKVIKFCPRCGAAEFSMCDAKSFTCKPCGFVYYINPAPAVIAIILNNRGQVLMARRKHDPGAGMLDLPGGFVDMDETAEQALIREVKEEVNLDIIAYRFIATYPNRYYFKGLVYFTTDLAFICSTEASGTVEANDDVSSAEWLYINEINPDDIGLDSVRRVVMDIQAHKFDLTL